MLKQALAVLIIAFSFGTSYAQVPSIIDSILLKNRPKDARVILIKSVSLNAYINLSESGKIVHEKSAQLVLEKDSVGVFIELWNDMTYYNKDSISDHYSTNYFDKKRRSYKMIETGNTYISRVKPVVKEYQSGDLSTFICTDTLTESYIVVHPTHGILQSKWTFRMLRSGLTLNTNWKTIQQGTSYFIVDSLGSETFVVEFKKNQPYRVLRCTGLGKYCTESDGITPNCLFPSKIRKSNILEEYLVTYGKTPILTKIGIPSPKNFFNIARQDPDFW